MAFLSHDLKSVQSRILWYCLVLIQTASIIFKSIIFKKLNWKFSIFNYTFTISETLRKYSSLHFLNRVCTEDFPIPDSNYTIPKGMRVLISSPGIQNNPEFYPDPDKFDPSRFSKENIASRRSYTYLGFGEGPRNCIGETKLFSKKLHIQKINIFYLQAYVFL